MHTVDTKATQYMPPQALSNKQSKTTMIEEVSQTMMGLCSSVIAGYTYD